MNTSSRLRWWGLCLLIAFASVPAAQTPLDGLGDSLSGLPAEARAVLDRRATRWMEWTAAQRSEFQRRLVAWEALGRAERDAIREGFQAWQQLPAPERDRVRRAAADLRMLPPEQQRALREAFDALDGSERRGWLLGPALGADYPALQPLLAQVPVEEHAPLLKSLRAMTPAQRRDLAVLVQRSAPQDRAQVRAEILQQGPDDISRWLWDRLQR